MKAHYKNKVFKNVKMHENACELKKFNIKEREMFQLSGCLLMQALEPNVRESFVDSVGIKCAKFRMTHISCLCGYHCYRKQELELELSYTKDCE